MQDSFIIKGLSIFVIIIIGVLAISDDSSRLTERVVVDQVSLCLSMIETCISSEESSVEEISQGYLNSEIELDYDEFIAKFQYLARNQSRAKYIEENIKSILVIDGDKIKVYNPNRGWILNEFFIYFDGVTDYYLNAQNNEVYYYNSKDRVLTDLASIGLDQESKEDLVIDELNSVIKRYTQNYNAKYGVELKIKNSTESENEEKYKMALFNPLDNLTVIAIIEAVDVVSSTFIVNRTIYFSNYAIVGYTIKKEGD